MAVATKQKAGVGLRWWYVPLLLAVPASVILWVLDSTGGTTGTLTLPVFILAAVALIPLAKMIGDATEALSAIMGNVIGGLLNATFSNVPELAIGIFLLIHAHAHASDAATVSSDHLVILGLIIGSVINNILLVLGIAVFAAALRHGRLRFSKERAGGYASMLALAVVGLSLPTLASSFNQDAGGVENVSLLVGLVLILSYVAYIGSSVFGWGEKRGAARAEEDAAQAEQDTAQAAREPDMRSNDAKQRNLFLAFTAFALLTAATVVIAFILVDSTDRVITATSLTPLSVGLIIFPALCNIGELAGVVAGAFRRDMELAMSVAGGSAVQVPLLVAPLLVVLALALSGGADAQMLPLIFRPVELIVVGLVTFVYALVSLDGEVTWLEGLQLLAFYTMIAITALALPGR